MLIRFSARPGDGAGTTPRARAPAVIERFFALLEKLAPEAPLETKSRPRPARKARGSRPKASARSGKKVQP